MSASRLGRVPLKKAKVPVPPNPPRKGSKSKIPTPEKSSPNPLPKSAHPLLRNLKSPNPSTAPIAPKSLAFFAVGVLSVSVYTGYLYATYKKEVKEAQSLQVPDDVSDRYNETATSYDSEVDVSEKLMRMGTKRRELIEMARGDVLEVSCGTGRNMEYYEFGERRGRDEKGRAKVFGCRSVTFVDLSPQMVEVARGKFEKLHPNKGGVVVAFRAEDAKDVLPPGGGATTPASSKRYFDTIVQTMGLCSMPDPVGTLRHLATITEPQKGRILLLEHGRSYYDWLNRILDNLAPAHADRHGCWWNRDIGEIVRQSGLEVVEEKRWHFGTTWRYVLRVREEK